MPDLSLCVVIPTLNEEEAIAELVRGLRAQGADRIVVADGGSTDRTRECAREAGAEVREVGRGRGAQLAAGAAGAGEDLLLFLHADNRLGADALAAVRRTFEDEGLGFAGLTQRVDAPGRFFRMVEGAANGRVGRGVVFGDSCLVCRTQLYERVGGFAALPLFEDVDLSRRLARSARWTRVGDAELVISARRWRKEGALRTTLRNWMLRVGYALGMSPERLARLYAAHNLSEPGPR